MQPSGGLLGPSPSPTSARPENDFRAYSIEDILLTDWQRGIEIITLCSRGRPIRPTLMIGGEPERAKMAVKPPIFASLQKSFWIKNKQGKKVCKTTGFQGSKEF